MTAMAASEDAEGVKMAQAVSSGSISELKRLVRLHPAAVNAVGSGETTPIHVAVAKRNRGALEIVRVSRMPPLPLCPPRPNLPPCLILGFVLLDAAAWLCGG